MGVTTGYKKKYLSLEAVITCASVTVFFSEEVKVNKQLNVYLKVDNLFGRYYQTIDGNF